MIKTKIVEIFLNDTIVLEATEDEAEVILYGIDRQMRAEFVKTIIKESRFRVDGLMKVTNQVQAAGEIAVDAKPAPAELGLVVGRPQYSRAIQTPLGEIVAHPKGDSDDASDYPGIYVSMNRQGEEPPCLLACVEWESSDGCVQAELYADVNKEAPTEIASFNFAPEEG